MTRHIFSHQGNPVGGIGSQKQAKESESLCSHCEESQKNNKVLSHNIYTEDLGQTPADSPISESPYESWSIDSVGHVLVVSLNPWFL